MKLLGVEKDLEKKITTTETRQNTRIELASQRMKLQTFAG